MKRLFKAKRVNDFDRKMREKYSLSSLSLIAKAAELALDVIRRGGDGVISVASNLFPAEMEALMHSAMRGDFETAEHLNSWFAPFFKACFIETNPIPIKVAMARFGYSKEIFRLPLCTLESEEHRRDLFSVVDKMMDDIRRGDI